MKKAEYTPVFKIGDVVRLRSGGPNMTVYEVSTKRYGRNVSCVWWNGTAYITESFYEDILERVTSVT